MDLPLPNNKKYQIIYADPPWGYTNKKTGGSNTSGAEDKYNTMSLEEIKSLPVDKICDEDCVLFLWATTPLKWEAFEVMKSWGFTYKTTIYWYKVGRLGMGFWFRGQVEELLLGIKGKIQSFRLQESNFLPAKPISHSRKPEEFRYLIERATSKISPGNKIELFSRQKAEGWDSWGHEAGKFGGGTSQRVFDFFKEIPNVITF